MISDTLLRACTRCEPPYVSEAQSEGTEIAWKADKNLTVKLVKKTVKKGKGRPKIVTKEEPVDSFFRYFETNDIPDEKAMEDMEQEEAMEVREGRGCADRLRLIGSDWRVFGFAAGC